MLKYQNFINPAAPINFASPLNRGLQAWYLNLPNSQWGNGTKWHDLNQGKRNDGTLTSSPTWKSQAGRKGGYGALSVISNSYISIPGAAIDFAALSYTAWINASAFTSDYAAIVCKNETSASRYAALMFRTNGKLACYVLCASGAVAYDNTGVATLSTNTWYHVAMTYDNVAGLKGYVNAVQDGTAPQLGTANLGSTTGMIGAYTLDYSTRWFSGLIDDVRIFNRALSANEVQSIYNDSLSGNIQTLNRVRITASTATIAQAYSAPAMLTHL